MQPPSSRLISLEPIPRRSRKHIKSSTKLQDALDTEKNEATASPNVRQNGDSPTTDESRSQPGSRHGTARSVRSRSFASVDLQSEISEDSAASTSSTGYIIGQTIESQRDSRRESVDVPPTPAGPRKTITAKIELGKSGCLPGDSIPITISIQHTKRIKSLHGIIITLYRQGRIDSSPPLSMFTDITGKDLERLKHEEYYPRSKTGLGGLSLTSPASSGVFRKDLSQTLAPIMIDPTTLSTEVTASVRVPEDVFPTVTGVPGEMISFKYYVEVVIDLGGKLAGQDRHLPRLGMVSLPSMTNPNGTTLGRDPGVAPTLAAWGGNIVNTDRIRREKSVVASLFEVVVGSTDSARQRGRGTTISRLTTLTMVAPSQTQNDERRLESSNGHYHNQHDGGYNDEGDYRDHRNQRASLGYGGYENEDQEWNINNGHDGRYQYNQRPHDIPEDYREHQVPDYAENSEPPPPEITPEEEMTEKDRVRLAEQRLLPSAPPPDDAASPAPRDDDQGPSAPPDPDKYGVSAYSDHPHQQNEAGPSTRPPPPSHRSTQQSARRAHNVIPPSSPSSSSAPSVPPTSSPLPPTDDKAELARRRLQAEASSPADLPHDGGDDAPSAPPLEHVSTTPPAPHVEEEDLYADDSRQPRHLFPSPGEHREELPEYQR